MKKQNTITKFSNKVVKFLQALGALDLVDQDDLASICSENPKALFTRFMKRRIERLNL